MCTALAFYSTDNSNNMFFGRTLDYHKSFGEQVVITPCNYNFNFKYINSITNHNAIIGMALVQNNYPLYYDACNDKGLAMAGLNFVGNTCYKDFIGSKTNITQYELIPFVLSKCSTVAQAKTLLENVNITNDSFADDMPVAQLHWIIADATCSIVVEAMQQGIVIYDNPANVLTNNPSFDKQLFNLNNYMHLTPYSPENCLTTKLDLSCYCNGLGALGLPGDWSSMSRFVRASYLNFNSAKPQTSVACVSQFFNIMSAVAVPKGACVDTFTSSIEYTIYTCCINTLKGDYCYTTPDNFQISVVSLNGVNLDTSQLVCYSLNTNQQLYYHNG